MSKDLPNVVAAHIADLRGCLPDLHSYGMTATALEFAKAADELEAALTAQPAAPAVVEGWKLVPKEPTGLMTLTGQQMRYASANSIGAIYREMLAAAPTPPEGPQP